MRILSTLLRSMQGFGVGLLGAFLFFVIIGVFGLRPAIIGLVFLILTALLTYRVAPRSGVDHDA